MFPNPQNALPLPSRPSLEQYRKLAKGLLKASTGDDPDTIRAWADRWIASLARSAGRFSDLAEPRTRDRRAAQVEEFATRTLRAKRSSPGTLADAQLVLARSHGFASWPRFIEHLDRLAHSGSDVAAFEAAADAIVTGDAGTLGRLIGADPGLVRARSTREHRATLLHYASANGVEGYRQVTPKNIVAIAKALLDAGAEVDAEADVYGGGSTTLGLAATSAHPRIAGAQIPLLEFLLDRGARMERRGMAGNDHGIVFACLANGCPEAAAFLAERGAPLDLVEAAGVGRLDVVRSCFDPQGNPKQGLTADRVHTAFRYACFCGRNDVVQFLIDRGVDLAGHSGDGQTGLHYAGMGGKLDTIKLLLRRGAPLEAVNEYGGTVLGQTLWSAAHGGDPNVYAAIVETLIDAGARLHREPPVNPKVDAILTRHGCPPDPTLWWYGERPRRLQA